MAKNIKTHLFCYDEHRGFADEVKKKFTDASRYTILSFQTQEDFLRSFQSQKENRYCKIAVFVLHDLKNEFADVEYLSSEAIKTDPAAGIILICPPEKIEEIKKSLKFNIDAYIPHNSNSILRLHNAVKKLISEHNIGVFRRRRNISLIVLFSFLLFSILFLLAAYFRLPQYF